MPSRERRLLRSTGVLGLLGPGLFALAAGCAGQAGPGVGPGAGGGGTMASAGTSGGAAATSGSAAGTSGGTAGTSGGTAGTSGGAAGTSGGTAGTSGGTAGTAGTGGTSSTGTGGTSATGNGGSSSGAAGTLGSGASTGAGGASAAGSTGAGGTTPTGSLTLTNLKIDPNPRMTLSCYVSWTTSAAANSEVQFGVSGYQFRIVDDTQVTAHKVHVVGMHAQTAYDIKAISTSATATGSATGTFTTGKLPTGLPSKGTLVANTPDKMQPGWTLTNYQIGGSSSTSTSPGIIVIVDAGGIPVWYYVHGTTADQFGMTSTDWLPNGHVLVGNASAEPPRRGRPRGQHHLEGPHRRQPGRLAPHEQALHRQLHDRARIERHGARRGAEPGQQGGLDLGPLRLHQAQDQRRRLVPPQLRLRRRGERTSSTSTAASRGCSRSTAATSRSSGRWARPSTTRTPATSRTCPTTPPASTIPTTPRSTTTGRSCSTTTRAGRATPAARGNGSYHSRVVEYELDEAKKQATLTWQFPGTFTVDAWYKNTWSTPIWGDADRLPNGNVLVTAGVRGSGTHTRIFEVTRAGEVVWGIEWPENNGSYRAARISPPPVESIP